MFTTPLPVARAMFALMAVLFAMSLVDLNPVFVFYTVLGLGVAGYLVAAAKEVSRR